MGENAGDTNDAAVWSSRHSLCVYAVAAFPRGEQVKAAQSFATASSGIRDCCAEDTGRKWVPAKADLSLLASRLRPEKVKNGGEGAC